MTKVENATKKVAQQSDSPVYPEHVVVGSLNGGETYTDEAITELYSAIIAMINTEAQLVWSRYL